MSECHGDTPLTTILTALVNYRHTAGSSTMFGTVLNYVSLRLLGVDREAPAMIEARGWIQKHGSSIIPTSSMGMLLNEWRNCDAGGAGHSPSWAQAWLSILNVHKWEGVNPIQPELWYVSVLELRTLTRRLTGMTSYA